jgi:hypothetical protein
VQKLRFVQSDLMRGGDRQGYHASTLLIGPRMMSYNVTGYILAIDAGVDRIQFVAISTPRLEVAKGNHVAY